jgi:hypothetical protein
MENSWLDLNIKNIEIIKRLCVENEFKGHEGTFPYKPIITLMDGIIKEIRRLENEIENLKKTQFLSFELIGKDFKDYKGNVYTFLCELPKEVFETTENMMLYINDVGQTFQIDKTSFYGEINSDNGKVKRFEFI